jgi:hypothetical protein
MRANVFVGVKDGWMSTSFFYYTASLTLSPFNGDGRERRGSNPGHPQALQLPCHQALQRPHCRCLHLLKLEKLVDFRYKIIF